jgi:hypothetical protein
MFIIGLIHVKYMCISEITILISVACTANIATCNLQLYSKFLFKNASTIPLNMTSIQTDEALCIYKILWKQNHIEI